LDTFFLIFKISQSKVTKTKKEKVTDIGWKNEEQQKIGTKMRIITCLGDWTRSGTLLSWTRITNNFINVFNGVTSPHVFVLHYFLTMPVGFNFNSTD